jgi:predicted ATPase with chaperone activity
VKLLTFQLPSESPIINTQEPCAGALAMVVKYQKRISALLLYCIDVHLEIPGTDYEKLNGNSAGESSG